MNLVVCCTMYQLITAINLLTNELKGKETDLLLVYATDFDIVKDKLYQADLFQRIYTMPNYLPQEREFRDTMSDTQRKKIEKDPCKFLDFSVIQHSYDHLYMAIDDVFGKLLYYYLLNGNNCVSVHLFEDGLASYIKNYNTRLLNDKLTHKRYGKKAFEKNIVQYSLYEPDLYCGSKWNIPITAIPKITDENQAVRECLKKIFVNEKLSQLHFNQPYLYLVEAFIDKKIMVEDVRLLNYIAMKVGKDNIAVKLHPRENIDRFTPRGYQVMKNFSLPWEILILANEHQKKALFSFSSTACLTAKLVFDMDFYGVFCYRMPLINASYALKDKTAANFLKLAEQKFNQEDKYLFTPSDFNELEEVLIYLKGILNE